MIIAVDYDDTLSLNGEPNAQLIAKLRQAQRTGNIVILWTCREGPSLIEAVNNLRAWGFMPNLINQNAREAAMRLGRDSRKIYADVYIDDKAVRP